MPRLKMWNPKKTNDYHYLDRSVGEYFYVSGVGIYLHKYIGSGNGGDETAIEDVVFMENRNYRYDDTIFELNGIYTPNDTEFDLTQFGLMLSNDTIVVDFHINQMVEAVGRKLMAGDVIEMPHLREHFHIDPETPAYNKFYVVDDVYKSDSGYDAKWWPHVWRVKAKIITASEKYADILGSSGESFVLDADGNKIAIMSTVGHGSGQESCHDNGQSLMSIISGADRLKDVNQAVIEEAEKDVKMDPLFTDARHLYVFHCEESGEPGYYYGSADGTPPNSELVYGDGDEFPEDMPEDSYFLRTDYEPATLYQKVGSRYKKITIDYTKLPWTGAHRALDTFLNNDLITKNDDGSTTKQKQALSKAVMPKVD